MVTHAEHPRDSPGQAELVHRLIRDQPTAVWYVAGTRSFAVSVGAALLGAGVSRDQVRMEIFRGYGDGVAPGEDRALARPPGPPSWNGLYRTQAVEKLPWFWPDLDSDLTRALDRDSIRRGRFLDVGTGPGTQAIGLAKCGFDVTATDIAPAAIEGAAERARAAGVRVDFGVDDVLEGRLEGSFDYVFDRGCLHVLPAEKRSRYVAAMHRLIRPGGLLFLKCFSDEEGAGDPNHFAPEDIGPLFVPDFEVVSIERTIIQGPFQHAPRALFCVLRRS